jgi:hypothetical protein
MPIITSNIFHVMTRICCTQYIEILIYSCLPVTGYDYTGKGTSFLIIKSARVYSKQAPLLLIMPD